jgi:RHS repeat-associated protein
VAVHPGLLDEATGIRGPPDVCVDTLGDPCPSAVGNPLGYTGAWRSPTTGLVHLRDREYLPALRIFASPDPAGIADATDLWMYVTGDPVKFWNPWGWQSARDEWLDHRSSRREVQQGQAPSAAPPPPPPPPPPTPPTPEPPSDPCNNGGCCRLDSGDTIPGQCPGNGCSQPSDTAVSDTTTTNGASASANSDQATSPTPLNNRIETAELPIEAQEATSDRLAESNRQTDQANDAAKDIVIEYAAAGALMLAAAAVAATAAAAVDPSTVRFSQNSVANRFSDGRSLRETIDGLKSGAVNPETIPPIRVFSYEGKTFTLDNRRLFVFQEAGIPIRTVPATAREIVDEAYKFTTTNEGTSIIVRGGL